MAEEVELTFRVTSPDPEGVFRDIASKHSMDVFRLAPRGSEVIRDTYLDTPGFDLGEKGYALRVRAKNGAVMLTLKGNEKECDGGGVSRLEIEGPWSVQALRQVAREIGSGRMETETFDQSEPLKSLEAMGFVVIQDRKTARIPIDVFFRDEETRFGEIALDRVRYETAGKGYIHYEIEIEAKGDVRQGPLSEWVRSLHEAFPGVLESWECNKLVTGLALEDLLRRGELPVARDEDSPLPPSWYDTIEAWIRKKKCRG